MTIVLLSLLLSCNRKTNSIGESKISITSSSSKFGELEVNKSTEEDIINIFGRTSLFEKYWYKRNSFDFPDLKTWEKSLSYEKKGIIFVLRKNESPRHKEIYKLAAVILSEKYDEEVNGIRIGESTFKDLIKEGKENWKIEKMTKENKILTKIYIRTQGLIFYSKDIDFKVAEPPLRESINLIENLTIEFIAFSRDGFRLKNLERIKEGKQNYDKRKE